MDLCGGTGSWSRPYRDASCNVLLLTLPTNDEKKVGFGQTIKIGGGVPWDHLEVPYTWEVQILGAAEPSWIPAAP